MKDFPRVFLLKVLFDFGRCLHQPAAPSRGRFARCSPCPGGAGQGSARRRIESRSRWSSRPRCPHIPAAPRRPRAGFPLRWISAGSRGSPAPQKPPSSSPWGSGGRERCRWAGRAQPGSCRCPRCCSETSPAALSHPESAAQGGKGTIPMRSCHKSHPDFDTPSIHVISGRFRVFIPYNSKFSWADTLMHKVDQYILCITVKCPWEQSLIPCSELRVSVVIYSCKKHAWMYPLIALRTVVTYQPVKEIQTIQLFG